MNNVHTQYVVQRAAGWKVAKVQNKDHKILYGFCNQTDNTLKMYSSIDQNTVGLF